MYGLEEIARRFDAGAFAGQAVDETSKPPVDEEVVRIDREDLRVVVGHDSFVNPLRDDDLDGGDGPGIRAADHLVRLDQTEARGCPELGVPVGTRDLDGCVFEPVKRLLDSLVLLAAVTEAAKLQHFFDVRPERARWRLS